MHECEWPPIVQGFHTKLPFITSMAQVQVSIQTDQVLEIPCGCSGGVMLTFDKIEVVNRLNKSHVLEVCAACVSVRWSANCEVVGFPCRKIVECLD